MLPTSHLLKCVPNLKMIQSLPNFHWKRLINPIFDQVLPSFTIGDLFILLKKCNFYHKINIKRQQEVNFQNGLFRSIHISTDYGRPVRKSPSLHGRKSTPTPKFLGTAEAYFVCHMSPNFQISLIYAFIGCPQSVFTSEEMTQLLILILKPLYILS